MIKKMIATAIICILFLGNIMVTAEEHSDIDFVGTNDMMENLETVSIEHVNQTVMTPSLIADIGSISVKERIQMGNKSVPLYCTFDSQEEALEKISNNSVIQLIKSNYGFEDISDAIWKQYYSAMYELFDSQDCPSWYTERNADFRRLRQFFDIYENKEKNDKIVSLINSVTRASEIVNNAEILELLPYDSYLTLSQQSGVLNNEDATTSSAAPTFSIDDGISYATSYATSPNKSDYDYFSRGDCTNFASQILENGGVAQEVYDNEALGWWHIKSTELFVTTHKHSISWIRADTFAKYMGVGYSTTSHIAFTSNIKKGDFIGADFDSDGDWEHMGFVTDKKSGIVNGYYDYKVAQHTANYHEWASSSKNGWDMIESDGGIYARVRR